MSIHDFSELYAPYPSVIAEMSSTFTSHEFILRLAQQNQRAYVEALYAYRENEQPFLTVHSILSKYLCDFTLLVESIGKTASINIFGRASDCEHWQKVA